MDYQKKICVWTMALFFLPMVFISCENDWKEYYDRPGWLKGNAWEVLEKKGDYSIFLRAVEKAGYKTLVNGKGLITVLAPDNEAFDAYLSEHGFTSVEGIPDTELKKLVGYHLVYYSFNKEQFADYNPNGSGYYNPLESGLYYKHRTKANNPITLEVDPLTEKEIKVIHKELFLPVLSENLFKTKQIEAKYNYEFFYPGSTWTGNGGGFNVSEASVSEYALVSDNGYVHLIDKVLEPQETIHQSLKNKGNFSAFLTMYDKFSYYWYDEEASKNFGNGDSLFVHKHLGLPQIASEWPYNGEDGMADYANVASLSKDAFSVFVPTDDAMDQFYSENWAPYYPHLNDVYFLQLGYLLDNHVYSGSLVFPDEIKSGKIITKYGTPIDFDPDNDVATSQICTNGAYYGLYSVQVPSMFKSVTGPAFRDTSYQMFLFMLDYCGMVLPLSGSSINYTIFYPTDETILKSGYYDLNIQYNNPNLKTFEDDMIQILDGQWRDMTPGEMLGFINSHITTEILTEVNGIKVYKTRNSFNYLYVKGESIASNRMYNENIPFTPIQKIDGNWSNGETYRTDTVLLKNSNPFKFEIGSADEYAYLSDFTEFSSLLSKAGLLAVNTPLDFIVGNYLVFIPTNEAILNAPAGVIPEDPAQLAEYLKYYFVPVATNLLSDYPFGATGFSANLKTYRKTNNVADSFTLTDVNGTLHITSPNGEADVVSELPKVYSDGAVYLINGLIQPQ